jgi:hypothetical protein
MEKKISHINFPHYVRRNYTLYTYSIILLIYNIQFGQEIFTRNLYMFQVILRFTTLRRILKNTRIFAPCKRMCNFIWLVCLRKKITPILRSKPYSERWAYSDMLCSTKAVHKEILLFREFCSALHFFVALQPTSCLGRLAFEVFTSHRHRHTHTPGRTPWNKGSAPYRSH